MSDQVGASQPQHSDREGDSKPNVDTQVGGGVDDPQPQHFDGKGGLEAQVGTQMYGQVDDSRPPQDFDGKGYLEPSVETQIGDQVDDSQPQHFDGIGGLELEFDTQNLLPGGRLAAAEL